MVGGLVIVTFTALASVAMASVRAVSNASVRIVASAGSAARTASIPHTFAAVKKCVRGFDRVFALENVESCTSPVAFRMWHSMHDVAVAPMPNDDCVHSVYVVSSGN